jgi:hypothetical protein
MSGVSKSSGSSQELPGYGLAEHRHRFALWAAARVGPRVLKALSRTELDGALAWAGVVQVVRGDPASRPSTAEAFDQLHPTWCQRLTEALRGSGVDLPFAQAAHLLATYLTATVVLGEDGYSAFGRVLHPPLDAELLEGLAMADVAPFRRHQALWRERRSMQVEQGEYFEVIEALRQAARDAGLPALWMLERYRVARPP